MSNRDRSNRKSGISDSNRHNKYHTNKWKNNWGRNFNNYGNSNYRNTDYGSGHSDNRYKIKHCRSKVLILRCVDFFFFFFYSRGNVGFFDYFW